MINFPGVLLAGVELGDATEQQLSPLLGHWDGSKGDPGESTEKVSRSFCFLIFTY